MDANIALDFFIGIVCFAGLLGLVGVVGFAYVSVRIFGFITREWRFHD